MLLRIIQTVCTVFYWLLALRVGIPNAVNSQNDLVILIFIPAFIIFGIYLTYITIKNWNEN